MLLKIGLLQETGSGWLSLLLMKFQLHPVSGCHGGRISPYVPTGLVGAKLCSPWKEQTPANKQEFYSQITVTDLLI